MKDIEQTKYAYPKVIEIEPIQNCNFKCTMCHMSVMTPNNIALDTIFLNNIINFPKGTHVTLGTSFEPTMHPEFAYIVQELSKKGFLVSMTTNGSLFTQKLVDEIKNANFHQITFSFDSAKKDSYEKIRINADYNKVVKKILNFKNSVAKKETYFSINATVIQENMYDMMETIMFAEKYKFNSIGFIAAIHKVGDTVLSDNEFIYDKIKEYTDAFTKAIDETLTKEYDIVVSSPLVVSENLKIKYPNNVQEGLVFKDKTVAKPPSVNGLQLGNVKGMPSNCISPFIHVRIKNDGSVMLCSRHIIGDIYKDSLEKIWQGKKAQYVREKIISEPEICYSCTYYTFCLGQHEIDYDIDRKNDRILNKRIDTSHII